MSLIPRPHPAFHHLQFDFSFTHGENLGTRLEKLVMKTPTRLGSRSPWWNDSARMKPASTEQLNISRLREGVIARENVASRV